MLSPISVSASEASEDLARVLAQLGGDVMPRSERDGTLMAVSTSRPAPLSLANPPPHGRVRAGA